VAHSKAELAKVAERRKKLIDARIAGRPFEDVWRELKYASRGAATKDFKRALEQNIAEQHASVEVYREAELMRLDKELARLTDLYEKVERIAGGNDAGLFLAATDRLLRIEDNRRRVAERRAKFLGLDAPVRAEVRTIDAIDEELSSLTKQLAALDREDREAAEVEGTAD
jgi:hypothetical protein